VKEKFVQKNFVEKLNQVRNLIKIQFPNFDMQNLNKIMSRFAHYHYDKKKFLIMGETKKLYDFLIENSYNPYTVYRWMLLERIPEEIKFQLRQNLITQKKAVTEAFKQKHETSFELTHSIKGYGLRLIGGM
jgi:hypothetical protein